MLEAEAIQEVPFRGELRFLRVLVVDDERLGRKRIVELFRIGSDGDYAVRLHDGTEPRLARGRREGLEERLRGCRKG